MLFEFIEHLRTSAPKYVKSLGYVYGAIAIEARHKRCQESWASHLENTKQVIRDFVRGKTYRTIYIFGSGGMHDAPLDTLLGVSEGVQLVDIIHLKNIELDMLLEHKVQLITYDVTGLAKPFYHWLKTPKNTPPPRPVDPGHLPGALKPGPEDLVISLNLISQLPIPFEEAANKADRPLPKDYGHQIISRHLNHIKVLPCDTLVIGDIDFFDYDQGEDPVVTDALHGNLDLLGAPDKFWDWHIGPYGEVSKSYRSVHRVGAWGNHKN